MPAINYHGAVIIYRVNHIRARSAIGNRIELIPAQSRICWKNARIAFTGSVSIDHIIMCTFSYMIEATIAGCDESGFLYPGLSATIGFVNLQLAYDICQLRRAAHRKASIENIRDKFAFIIHSEKV